MMGIPPKRPAEIAKENLRQALSKDLAGVLGVVVQEVIREKQKKKPAIRRNASGWDQEKKDRHGKDFILREEKKEEELKKIVTQLFEEEKNEVIQNVNNLKHWRKDARKGRESSLLPSKESMVKRWIAVFLPFTRETVLEEGANQLDFIGVGGELDITTDRAARFLRDEGAAVVSEITEKTRENLAKTLAQGMEAGETVDQMRKRVDDVFNVSGAHRSEVIARTETTRALTFATEEAYIQSGIVESKEWLTTNDERLCSWCESMDGTVVKIGQPFFNEGDHLTIEGERLDFDLLDVDGPPLHAMCRCTLIPVLD